MLCEEAIISTDKSRLVKCTNVLLFMVKVMFLFAGPVLMEVEDGLKNWRRPNNEMEEYAVGSKQR